MPLLFIIALMALCLGHPWFAIGFILVAML